jgi:hypothetical protein
MGMQRMLAILLVSLAACAEPVPWHGDVTFTPEERASIEGGAAFLSAHTDREIVIVWDAPHLDGSCRTGTIQRRSDPGAATDRINGCIYIGTQAREAAYMARLAAHEMAHWRGMNHVANGLMMPVARSSDLEWTEEDEAEYVRARDH